MIRPTDRLREAGLGDWQAATAHAFTAELAAGTLPPERMAGYLQQDYIFVEEFVRLLAAAISHAPALADALPPARFLGLVSSTENTCFQRAFAHLGVPDTAPPAPAARTVTGLMREARLSGRYGRMLAVLLVAEWSYLDWATPHAGKAAGLPFWPGKWITLHAGEGFEALVAHLRAQLDRAHEEADTGEREAIADPIARTTAAERAFFDAAEAGFPVAR